MERFFGQGRFLYPAFAHFYREDLLDLLRQHGTPCRVDHQGKYFPVSDQAADVLKALTDYARSQGVQIRTGVAATGILHDSRLKVVTHAGLLPAAAVIVTTGGQTYPSTGSTGDGYRFAAQLGHTIERIRPALVPLNIEESAYRELAGLSLDAVEVTLLQEGQKPVRDKGDFLFTHKGVSGPVILRLSRALLSTGTLMINLMPDQSHDQLSQQILTLCSEQPRSQLKNVLDSLIPHRLAEPLLNAAGLPAALKAAQVSRKQAEQIAKALQQWALKVSGHAGQHLAMVTAGGVSLQEVQPKTMESKQIPGLFFAGEVLDLDGDTGGFNLQAAFSTGYLAGESAAAFWQKNQ